MKQRPDPRYIKQLWCARDHDAARVCVFTVWEPVAPQVIRGFREQHATAPKSWIDRRVKEDAAHNGAQWVVKADVLRAFGARLLCGATPSVHARCCTARG